MTLHPSDLRAGRLLFLFDLTWGGQVYRVAEDVVAPTLDGETYTYTDGLEWGGSYQDKLALFSIDPAVHSITMTLNLADLVDVPAREAAGHVLGSATGLFRLWLEGTTEARTILDGEVRQVEYGAAEEPVTITLEEAPLRAPGRIPGELQRVKAPSDYDGDAPSVLGQYYPYVFGRPGGTAVYAGFGSPALVIELGLVSPSGGAKAVVAAHPCVPGDVTVQNGDTRATAASLSLATELDPTTGVLRTIVLLPKTNIGTDTSSPPDGVLDEITDVPFYVGWRSGGLNPDGGGLPSRHDPTVPMRSAGEILTWLLERSGARVDYGRLVAAEPLLAGYQLDFAIVPGAEERVSPLEWVQDHLLPILPLTARLGPNGLYYVVWRWDATEYDAVARLSANEGGLLSRVSAVEYGDRDDVYQEIRFDYALSYSEDKHTETLTYTWDRQKAATDSTIVHHPSLYRSFIEYARGERHRVRVLELASDVVLSSATAHLVLQQLASRHGLQSRGVRYDAEPELAWLQPGDVVIGSETRYKPSGEVRTGSLAVG